MGIFCINLKGGIALEYQYPLRNDWTTSEIVSVIHFYESIEKAYESSIYKLEMADAYREFKKIVPSKAEEKILFKEFEQVSGYRSYEVIKALKEDEEQIKIMR